MPKSPPLISTEVVLRELSMLDGEIRLIPEQVSKIMGISTSQLEELRQDEEPKPGKARGPAWVKQGGKVLYRIEAVRSYLKSQPEFTSLNEEKAARSNHSISKNLGGTHLIDSFNSFLNHGSLADSWTFTIVKGKPIDFIASLRLQIEDDLVACRDLTLEEYLSMRLKAGHHESAKAEHEELTAFMKDMPVSTVKPHTPL